ncbi:hypothetical protein K2173_015633 [Erythroxylum novogranatense]|uniref:J domain-containing protein n=1 Tax=Erythroxylum novogranatense TaxID=1862640 RepID=A0AAV8SEL0_9ROSI|nr:hypothetical protein K2173_015633 [Erythroxylum novogranatense]
MGMDCLHPPPHNLLCLPHLSSRSVLSLQNHENPSMPSCRHQYGGNCTFVLVSKKAKFSPIFRNGSRICGTLVRANSRESPYQVLGVSPAATPDEIKRAYRKLALKYHPDVNKEKNAEQKFMKIKHAYNTLLNSESTRKYGAANSSGFSYSSTQRSQKKSTQDEDFYGFGNFLRDVQITIGDLFRDLTEEFQNWEASSSSYGKPKSLWEELAEIGEEFVEFLEKELNITDTEAEVNENGPQEDDSFSDPGKTRKRGSAGNEQGKRSSIEDNIDDIEATLAKLKKELGL